MKQLASFLIINFFISTSHAQSISFQPIDYFNLSLSTILKIEGQISSTDQEKLKNEWKNVQTEYASLLRSKIKSELEASGSSSRKKDVAEILNRKLKTKSVKKSMKRVFSKQMAKQLRFDPAAKARKCNLIHLKNILLNINLSNQTLSLLRLATSKYIQIIATIDFTQTDKTTYRLHLDTDGEKNEVEGINVEFNHSEAGPVCLSEDEIKALLTDQLESEQLQNLLTDLIDQKVKNDQENSNNWNVSKMIDLEL